MKRQKSDSRRTDSGHAHLGARESGNAVEAWVKRVKHVGNEEETSESTSNGAVVASLGRSVGGHARVGASESDSLEQKRKCPGKERLSKKYGKVRRTSFW